MATKTTKAPSENGGDKPCVITREQFKKAPATLSISVGGATLVAARHDFKPDKEGKSSFGYFVNEKVTMEVDGMPVRFQGNLILTVVNSKNAK